MRGPIHNPARLAHGGAIDRERPLDFSFNGRRYTGYEGDTLASALLANGVKVLGRSFKYHRPRGVFTAGEEEPCAIVETGHGDFRVPNCRATTVPLKQGLVANSQNCWPFVGFDIGRLVDFTHFLWPAGFYHKTFKRPGWRFWEGMIRHSAGLGRPLTRPDPDHYEQVNAHCDLLICGGGPAGLIAALIAGRSGARVMLAEQAGSFGGMLNGERVEIEGASGAAWARQIVVQLQELSNVMLLPQTVVSGIYDHNVTALLQTGRSADWRECLWTVRPQHILLATGAIEQGLIFPNNDRPGIMLAAAVRHYVNRFAVAPGKKAVVASNNDSAYQTVFDLARQQIAVKAVVDCRKEINPEIRQRLIRLGTEVFSHARIGDTKGNRGIKEVRIERLDGPNPEPVQCDLLAVSGGWSPRLHLLAHARGGMQFDVDSQSFLPTHLPAGLSVAGAANGNASLPAAIADSARITSDICESLGYTPWRSQLPTVNRSIVGSRNAGKQSLDLSKPRQWIDLAHDVTLGDAQLAVREGYIGVEHFKRFTTTGMSLDQGKTGNINAFIVLASLTGREPGEVGTTTFRPPYMPVTLGAFAGRNIGDFYAPERYLPAHRVHEELNAQFGDYGWQRPDCYPRMGEMPEKAVIREVKAVRATVGVFDNSPIGKLEVHGPDAAEFLNRLYINNVLTLKPGRARYGLMLNENGVIIDDGVFLRLAEDHFVVHATSGGVARVAAMMEESLQCDWTGLQVLVDDMTTQWANFTIAGPRARDVLTALDIDIDISGDALPHMAASTAIVAGLEARLARISFSGELSFELNIPAAKACWFLRTVLKAGEKFNITPYGIESLMVLRTEMGYLHVGSDTDGSSTPDDMGWGRVARGKTPDYIGKRSLFRPANQDPERKQFIGLEPLDPNEEIRSGAHLLIGGDRQPPAETDGWVTSACYSPHLERHIALGVLSGGRERTGEIVTVCDEGRLYQARVVSPVFYDPNQGRSP